MAGDIQQQIERPVVLTPAAERAEEPPQLEGFEQPTLVGSLFWTLRRGDQWVLGPESAFLFRDCWRQLLVREAYMLEQASDRRERWKDGLKTLARRWVTGEPFMFDLYLAECDGAELAISSDEIGGNLYMATVGPEALVCRKAVYFGSEVDVKLRVASPLAERSADGELLPLWQRLKRTAYGPGWVFQRFVERRARGRTRIILQIDGDASLRELREGERLRTDPRHAYAWDESVSWRLVKFGAIQDRLLRGSIPFQVEFEGPGRLWLSNMSFSDGYLGEVCTPSHWIFRLQQAIRNLLSYLNPFNWL